MPAGRDQSWHTNEQGDNTGGNAAVESRRIETTRKGLESTCVILHRASVLTYCASLLGGPMPWYDDEGRDCLLDDAPLISFTFVRWMCMIASLTKLRTTTPRTHTGPLRHLL